MKLTTPVIIKPNKSITHHSKIVMFGSCFAEHIAQRLVRSRIPTVSNPMGVTYNPLSIAASIGRLIDNRPYTADDLFCHNGIWASLMHHSRFSHDDQQKTLDAINREYEQGRHQLLIADFVIITLGSSYIYEKEGQVVNNCHKLPARQFSERQLSVDDVVTSLTDCIKKIHSVNPLAKIIFTVSPIRYMGRGAHNGQINKSTLLLAVSQLCQQQDICSYFPSYEIVMDELRDYRFYAADMIHLADIAIDYIWERFCETYFPTETIKLIEKIEKINKMLAHRPLHTDSETYKQFIENRNRQIDEIRAQYPEITFDI